MVSARPLISKSSNSCTNPLVTVPRTPVTIGITVTFVFYSFINSLARYRYLSFFSLSFRFLSILLVISRDSKVHYSASLLFYCLPLGLFLWPRLGDPFVCENPRGVCASNSPGHILGCTYIICSYDQI